MDVAKIAVNLVTKWPTKQELSLLSPRLSQENVRLIGIGLEELGVEEFVEKKFWAGELYIDEKKKSFNDLGYKRFSIWSMPGLLLARIARSQASKAKERGVGGDLRGDGFQNGGLLVVGKGGKVLYSFVQENPADHAANEDILKALNFSVEKSGGEQAAKASPPPTSSCTDEDVCSVKPKSPASE